MSVAETAASMLSGMDPDILEYVTGMLEEMDVDERCSQESLNDSVAPFLVSSGFVEEDDAAEEICTKLAAAFASGGATEEKKEIGAPWPVQQRAPIVIADQLAQSETAAAVPELPKKGFMGTEQGEDSLFDSKSKRIGKDDKKAIATREANLEKFRQENTALENEVERALETAAELRSKHGAFLGAVEVKQFTLPNPGGGENLIDDASFNLVPGKRYGLIGRNGKGKSTMLRWLAARRVGSIPPSVTIHYVSQDVTLSATAMSQTPLELVLEADVERHLLEKEAADINGGGAKADMTMQQQDRLVKIEERLREIDAHSAPQRARALLQNLGFSEEMITRKMDSLSGGWRVRTALAAAIFAAPDMLCLDEPTNHLSIAAVMWLAHELRTNETWKNRIVVMVSHDRIFLDDVCTDTLHISGVAKRLTASQGNYTMWAKRRAEQQKALERTRTNRAAERQTLLEYTQHGFKYGGSSSQINMQQMKLKQIAKLDAEAEAESQEWAALQEDSDLPLKIQSGGHFDGAALQLQNVGFRYAAGGPMLFKGAEFTVDCKSRVVLLGENGNGKSTLLKLMMEQLTPVEGRVVVDRGARFALVNQHHADQLDMAQTPLDFMRAKYPGDGSYNHDQTLRSALDRCGVGAILQGTLASALSGGQRSRVALAAVSFGRPHVLFLDEPTNNLDLEAVSALSECIDKFEGGIVLVSHDQYFVGKVAKEVWVVENQGVRRCESFESYRKQQLKNLKLT